jgi:DNA (cytosine-5)-methyltransferase 1
MQGGKRKGAGRNALLPCEKKLGRTIYLTDEQYEAVQQVAEGSTFSEKCAFVIDNYMIHLYYPESTSKSIRVIDLFAGLGGIRLGFEKAFQRLGYTTECVLSSEIKPHAIKAYKQFFKDKHIQGDITKIASDSIPDFDFLLAGFPCQPFSSAGKGLGFEDTRGTLFFEIERILRDKKPFGFLLENVEGLVTHDSGKTLAVIVRHLKALGYHVSWKLINSKEFGLAQARNRVYIAGTKHEPISLDHFSVSRSTFGDIMQHDLPGVDSVFTRRLLASYPAETLCGKAIKDKRGGKENIHSWDFGLKGEVSSQQKKLLNAILTKRRMKKWAGEIGIDWMDGMPLTKTQIKTFFHADDLQQMLDDLVDKGYLTLEHPRSLVNRTRIPDTSKPKGYNIVAGKLSFEFTKILDPKALVPTLVAMDVSHIGVIDEAQIRRLSIREGLRLCGYPESYSLAFLKDSEAFDLLGNTVCVPVIQAITERLAAVFDNRSTAYTSSPHIRKPHLLPGNLSQRLSKMPLESQA